MDRTFNSAKCNHDFVTACEQLGVGDMAQYQVEKQLFSFDKLCMIQIDNSDLLLTFLGGTDYFAHLRKAVAEIHAYMLAHDLNDTLHPYVMDDATFLIAGIPELSEKLFFANIKKLYKKFQFLLPAETDIPILFRFAVVHDQPHMLECAIEALRAKRNMKQRFILCESGRKDLKSTKQELRMIGVIQWAIQNNGVIPYYQGLYDNQNGGINKYESLMRLVDKDGMIYSPADFMEIAKKYHMYIRLSELMVQRVLREVDDKPIAVSINLSAYDINSSDFQRKLFSMLQQRTSKELLVFEILEDEVFEEPENLQKFVNSVKQYGAKIAIDDFGSGYSNLLEIAQITPEYLKIDGGIILRITNCARSQSVFESILYLAQKINSKTVAEHVESIELLHYLQSYHVDFSQGYCLSKPLPMEILKTIIMENKGMIV